MIVSVFFRESSNQGDFEGRWWRWQRSSSEVGRNFETTIHLQKPVDPNLCWTFLFWFFIDIWLKPQARIYGDLSMFAFTFIRLFSLPSSAIWWPSQRSLMRSHGILIVGLRFVCCLWVFILCRPDFLYNLILNVKTAKKVLNLLFSIKFFVFAQKRKINWKEFQKFITK